MTGTAEDIADRIVILGFGSITTPVTIFIGEMPSSPDNCITVKELVGGQSARAMGRNVMDLPDVQVLIRRTTYDLLKTAVVGIRGNGLPSGAGSGLDGWSGAIDGKQYYFVRMAYEPVYLGKDENNRRTSSMVFNIHRER